MPIYANNFNAISHALLFPKNQEEKSSTLRRYRIWLDIAEFFRRIRKSLFSSRFFWWGNFVSCRFIGGLTDQGKKRPFHL